MPKVKFNKLIESFSGRIGDLIFYQADGQNLTRTAPRMIVERSDKQAANSDRFLAAEAYAARALVDPLLKAAYKALCRGHQNARNLAIRDALLAPVIESVNLDGYAGKPGQIVRVKATDDFRVVEVTVTVRSPGGELIEEGMAGLGSDEGEWRYTSTAEAPVGQSVSVVAVAKDTAGNRAECQRWHHIPAV